MLLTFVIYSMGYNRLQRKCELSLLWTFQEDLKAKSQGIEIYALRLTSVTETSCNTIEYPNIIMGEPSSKDIIQEENSNYKHVKTETAYSKGACRLERYKGKSNARGTTVFLSKEHPSMKKG